MCNYSHSPREIPAKLVVKIGQMFHLSQALKAEAFCYKEVSDGRGWPKSVCASYSNTARRYAKIMSPVPSQAQSPKGENEMKS